MKDLAEINRRVFRMEKQIENLEKDNKHLHEMLGSQSRSLSNLLDIINALSIRVDVVGERVDIARDKMQLDKEELEAMIVENSDKLKTL